LIQQQILEESSQEKVEECLKPLIELLDMDKGNKSKTLKSLEDIFVDISYGLETKITDSCIQ